MTCGCRRNGRCCVVDGRSRRDDWGDDEGRVWRVWECIRGRKDVQDLCNIEIALAMMVDEVEALTPKMWVSAAMWPELGSSSRRCIGWVGQDDAWSERRGR